jgi:hypothetical protein
MQASEQADSGAAAAAGAQDASCQRNSPLLLAGMGALSLSHRSPGLHGSARPAGLLLCPMLVTGTLPGMPPGLVTLCKATKGIPCQRLDGARLASCYLRNSCAARGGRSHLIALPVGARAAHAPVSEHTKQTNCLCTMRTLACKVCGKYSQGCCQRSWLTPTRADRLVTGCIHMDEGIAGRRIHALLMYTPTHQAALTHCQQAAD